MGILLCAMRSAMPGELIDAALIDGCGYNRYFHSHHAAALDAGALDRRVIAFVTAVWNNSPAAGRA